MRNYKNYSPEEKARLYNQLHDYLLERGFLQMSNKKTYVKNDVSIFNCPHRCGVIHFMRHDKIVFTSRDLTFKQLKSALKKEFGI